MTKSPNYTLTIEEIDTINKLLEECRTVSELLWVSNDVEPETSARAGVMIATKIKKIQGIIRQH